MCCWHQWNSNLEEALCHGPDIVVLVHIESALLMVYLTAFPDVLHRQLTLSYRAGGSKGCTDGCPKARSAAAQSRKRLPERPAQQHCLTRQQCRPADVPGHQRGYHHCNAFSTPKHRQSGRKRAGSCRGRPTAPSTCDLSKSNAEGHRCSMHAACS